MAPVVARSLVPSPTPAPTLVLVAQPLILPTPSSSSPPFSPSLSLPFPFSGFHFPRENGETQQCPPHSNACDDNNSPSLPSSSSTLTTSPSFSSSTSSPNATPAAMAFFAVGCIILALIVGFCLWFIHRRRENNKVFPCCGASSSKRAIRKSSTRQGRAARPSGSSPLNGPMVLPPVTDGQGFPPGLSSPTADNVPMVKQDSNAKWRPLEEFSSFDAAHDAPIQIHVVRQVEHARDSLSVPVPASPLPSLPSPSPPPSPTPISSRDTKSTQVQNGSRAPSRESDSEALPLTKR